MLYVGAEGAHIVPLGRAETRVGSTPIQASTPLEAGSTVSVPGVELVIETEDAPKDDDEDAVWVVERVGGGLFGVGARGITLGSGVADDVRVEGLPQGAVALRVAQGRLFAEATTEVRVGDSVLPAGGIQSLVADDVVAVAAVQLRILAGDVAGAGSTAGVGGRDEPARPTRVELAYLPRGGRLSLTLQGEEYALYLADRRCDLVACLLRPPTPYRPGDAIPDEVLMSKLWPRTDVSGSALNVLLHRLRKDLVRAGVDGCDTIARPPGGGAVRFSLDTRAHVMVC